MNFNANTPAAEFIEWLHDAAVKGGMPPQFIDRVDDLHALVGIEDGIAEANERAEIAKDMLADLQCAFDKLLKALEHVDNGGEFLDLLAGARAALKASQT